MDKETYKVALDILNRFADTTTRMQHQQTLGVARKLNENMFDTITSVPHLRSSSQFPAIHSNVLTTPTKLVPKPSSNLTPFSQQRQSMPVQPQPRTPIRGSPQLRVNPNAPILNVGNASPMNTLTSPRSIQQAQMQMQMQRRWQPPHQITPYPIINQNQKNLFEKVVDYLIGEGPSSRYGMICKECHGHNGKFSEFISIFFGGETNSNADSIFDRNGVARGIRIFSI